MKAARLIVVALIVLLVQDGEAVGFSSGSVNRRVTAQNMRRKNATVQSSVSRGESHQKTSVEPKLGEEVSVPSKGGASLIPEGFDEDATDSTSPKGIGQKVLSAEGLAIKDNIKVEYGEGHGETPDDALKEAMKDVLQKVVGVYVDSDFRMNNDKVIKDEIITHSNGFIDHYKKIEESDDANGRGKVVTIKAWVKMRDFVNRMKKVAPKQTVKMDGLLLDNEVSNKANSEILLRKELESINPIMDLMEVRLVENIRPAVLRTTDESVTLRYVFQIKYSRNRYYNEFLPRFCRVMDQIAEGKGQDRSMQLRVWKDNLFPVGNHELQGTGWHGGYGWKEQKVSGYFFDAKKSYCNDSSHVRVMTKINSGGASIVREWKISPRLVEVYKSLWKDIKERSMNISCVLKLNGGNGCLISQAETEVVWECFLLNGNFSKIDFRPLIWNGDFVAGVDMAHSDWIDRYVGYIDIGVDRSDVAKIKSAEIRLVSNKEEGHE